MCSASRRTQWPCDEGSNGGGIRSIGDGAGSGVGS